MSMFVFNENTKKILNFYDYILSESIEPIEIDFGTDFKNKDWYSVNGFNFTFLKVKDSSVDDLYFNVNKFTGERPYCVIIDSQTEVSEVGFATGDYTPKDFEKLKDVEIMKDYFDFELKKRTKALRIINYAFYVILEGMNHFKIDTVSFKGSNPDLIYTYNLMIRNNLFKKKLDVLGFKFLKTEDDKHFLERK